jgi:hypothetical protein
MERCGWLGVGVLLTVVAGPIGVEGKGSSGNSCNEGRGYCVQWTNHSQNPNSFRNPMGQWECTHGQIAIGFPDEAIMSAPDANGNMFPIAYTKAVEHPPDSVWVDDQQSSGQCKGCGCHCDTVRASALRPRHSGLSVRQC